MMIRLMMDHIDPADHSIIYSRVSHCIPGSSNQTICVTNLSSLLEFIEYLRITRAIVIACTAGF